MQIIAPTFSIYYQCTIWRFSQYSYWFVFCKFTMRLFGYCLPRRNAVDWRRSPGKYRNVALVTTNNCIFRIGWIWFILVRVVNATSPQTRKRGDSYRDVRQYEPWVHQTKHMTLMPMCTKDRILKSREGSTIEATVALSRFTYIYLKCAT